MQSNPFGKSEQLIYVAVQGMYAHCMYKVYYFTHQKYSKFVITTLLNVKNIVYYC